MLYSSTARSPTHFFFMIGNLLCGGCLIIRPPPPPPNMRVRDRVARRDPGHAMPDEDQKDDHAAAASPQRSSRPSWPLVTARRLACSRWPIPRLRASPLSAGSVRLRAPCLRSSSSFRRGGAGVQVGSPPAIADPSYAHQLPHRPISYPIVPSATPSSHHPIIPSSRPPIRPSGGSPDAVAVLRHIEMYLFGEPAALEPVGELSGPIHATQHSHHRQLRREAGLALGGYAAHIVQRRGVGEVGGRHSTGSK